jgi:hypothetical protein
MLEIGSDPDILADVTHGRVPVISWRCGDDAPPNSASTPLNLIQIANGQADPDLANIEAQLMMLEYPGTSNPYPVRNALFLAVQHQRGTISACVR